MIPASIGFMVLSRLIIETLFTGGKFDAVSTQITSGALLFYSIGLFAYAGSRIVQNGFFALKDTRTPTLVSAVALVLNVLLNTVFMFPLKLNGLALATSVSGIVSFLLLSMLLNRKTGGLDFKGLAVFASKVLLAGAAMGAVCYLTLRIRLCLGCPVSERVLRLLIPVVCGIITYLLLCFALRIEQAARLMQWLKARVS
jgi:putative peptidoglycan lipid II flippase